MRSPVTVSLNCAGSGRRLGLGQTKALLDILGRPLIHWQLDLLDDVRDLRVVVGFNAPEVISAVLARRPDAIFVLNHAYGSTATGDSLLLASEHGRDWIFSLDGDLLIRPRDLARLLTFRANVIGITRVTTDAPLCVDLDQSNESLARAFLRDRRAEWEWSGAAMCRREDLLTSGPAEPPRHVYQLLEPLLPLRAVPIEAREIDTSDDYRRAVDWMQGLVSEGQWRDN